MASQRLDKSSQKRGKMGEVNKTNNYTEFFYRAFRNILLVSVPLTVVAALILGFTSHSSANTASSDDITLKLDVACTVSSVVTSPHSALDMNVGQYKTDIGNTDISVFCNDNNGYSVYAIGNSNSTDGNSDLISNINENYNIHTGTNATGNSSWSMKLTAGTGTSSETTPPSIVNGYNNYSLIPNNYTLVATRPSGTSMNPDTSASGSYFSTTYAIYAASTQPAGTYNGKVKYVMVHPNNSTHNTIPDIEAAFAAAGKQKAYQDAAGNYYYAMQDMNPTICASVTRKGEITATQLVDKRDNNLYYVTKEKDGNCWMTQNLDLKLNDPNTRSLTSENTDISDDPTVYTATPYATGYTVNNGIYTWTPSNTTTKATVNYTDNKIDGAWTHSHTAPASAEGGDTYIYTNNTTGDTPDDIYNPLQVCIETGHAATDCRHYHVGNYYNWTAAIASNNSTNFNTNYNNAANSICPKGWRLPIATNANNESREFGGLLVAQGIMSSNTANSYAANGFINIRKSPLWFVRPGYINGGTLYSAASNGYYWSSTVSDSYNAYDLLFNPGNVYPAYNDYGRRDGRSVRCLARSADE